MGGLLANKLFSMARNKEFSIPGFPDFQTALQDLKSFQRTPQPAYTVTVPTGEGHLIITEALVSFWSVKHTQFADQLAQLKADHDAEFNHKGLKRGSAETSEDGGEEEQERPSKRLCLSTSLSPEELETQHSDRTDSF